MYMNLLRIIAILIFINIFSLSYSQKKGKINWVSFEQSVELGKKNPKPIFIDVYTNWCGWCHKMDATTFKHPEIVKFMNDNFYAVKLNAEMKDTVRFDTTIFVNPNPNGRRSSHQLAIALLQGKMSYPSYVFLNDKFQKISTVPGYHDAKFFEKIINYFADEAYKEKSFEEYSEEFKSKIE